MRLQIFPLMLVAAASLIGAAPKAVGNDAPTSATVPASEVLIQRQTYVEQFNGGQGFALRPVGSRDPLWSGATLVYELKYTNASDKPQRILITNPLPASVVYLSSQASGIDAEKLVSVDGGLNFGTLQVLRVRSGKSHWYPASARDVTHVRFMTERDVGPGESGQFTVRLRLK